MIVGTEWLVEALGCDPELLRDEGLLRSIFDRVITDLGLRPVGSVWHKFKGEGGVTGLIALTESHLACHTYPEYGTATFNLYCCRERPEWDWRTYLHDAVKAESVSVTRIERGESTAAVPAAVERPSRPQVESEHGRKLVNYGETTLRHRGRLPHLEKEDGIYFVTFRLADSLPQAVLERLRAERTEAEKVLSVNRRELRASEKQKLDWLFSEKVDSYLDRNFGECELKNAKAAKVVSDALTHFDGERYNLYAWCVMPNHVHVVFKVLQRAELDEILHSWKSYTAHEVNKVTGRTGELWQREYYDRLVRNENELAAMVRYTLNNPAAAGFQNWPWVGGREIIRTGHQA